jgi:hypothetical protein
VAKYFGSSRPIRLRWPFAGIVTRFGFHDERGYYGCPDALNVWPDSAGVPSGASQSDYVRERGGSRPGLGKAFSQQVGSGNPIRMLTTIQFVTDNKVNRRIVGIANGGLFWEDSSGALATIGGTFNPNKNIQGAERNQILYIADHADSTTTSTTTYQPKKFTPSGPTVSNWTASDGTIPYGSIVCCNWRDRLLLAGGTTSPFGVFASRLGDPEDWDFSEDDVGAAWAVTLADAGLIGDTVTALVPHSNDCLVIFCTNSIWIMRGDPSFGGTIDNISRQIGCIGPDAWCVTPEGLIVFASADGIYVLPAGCSLSESPTSLSRERMPQEFLAVNWTNPESSFWYDSNNTTVALGFDIQSRGVIITLTANSAAATSGEHWWLDWETKSFWKMQFGSPNHEPFTLHSRRNFIPTSVAHSTTVWGCRDGYVRRFVSTNNTDDSSSFSSYVFIGPITDPNLLSDTMLSELIGIVAKDSSQVMWSIHVGDTPEDAFEADEREQGIWNAGRNNTVNPRVSGGALYLKLANVDTGGWGIEAITAMIGRSGRSMP